MKKITFGIVGIGKISHRFIKGLQYVEGAQVLAVASRSQERAWKYAEPYAIPYAYENYEEMLQNPEIDAVYIATPNDTHHEYMMKALSFGKHVICEKPFTVHTKEAQEVFEYAKAKGLLVMEAMKACFLPTTLMVKQWIQQHKIGQVRYIEAGYCSRAVNIPQTHHLFDKERGGGSFYDVGIYPLAFVNELQSARIINYTAKHVFDHGIDSFTQVLLQYEDGVIASVRSSIMADMDNTAVIYGDAGTIRIPQFWKSEKAYLHVYGQEEIIFDEVHHASEFRYQIQHFVDLIRNGKSESNIMSMQATVRNMQLLEDIIFDK